MTPSKKPAKGKRKRISRVEPYRRKNGELWHRITYRDGSISHRRSCADLKGASIRSPKPKKVRVKAWIILGTDDSIISEVFWWRMSAIEKKAEAWPNDRKVRVIPCEITYNLPTHARK